jgi:hypothetical protein
MVARGLTIIAFGCLISTGLSPVEQKLVGSWQFELPTGARYIDTFEPDRTYWSVISDHGKNSLRVAGKWQIAANGTVLSLKEVQYGSPDAGPPEFGLAINEISEQTAILAQGKFTRCERPEKPSIPTPTPSPTPTPTPPNWSPDDYFPAGVFSDREDENRYWASSFSLALAAFDEPPLFSRKPDKEIECYRFLWTRSFHNPVVLRVDVKGEDDANLTIKVGELAPWSHKIRKLTRNEKKRLGKDAVESLKAAVRRTNFFELPPYEKVEGLDGSYWTIEALVAGRYHVVTRWSPEKGPVREIGMMLIEYAIGGDLVPVY